MVSLYCNLSPHQMFLHLNTVMFIPEIPARTYRVVATCLRAPGLTEVMGKVTGALGRGCGRAGKGENPWTEGGVGHMRMPADDFRLTCGSKGRPWGQKGVDNSHKSCNVRYFEFSSWPGSARPGLIYCILPFYTENFSFKFSFDSVLTFGATGEDAF